MMMMMMMMMMVMVWLGIPQLDHLLHQLQLRLELQLRLDGLADILSSSRSKIFGRLDHSVDLQGRLCSHGRGSSKAGCAGEQSSDGRRLPSVGQLKGSLSQCRTLFQVAFCILEDQTYTGLFIIKPKSKSNHVNSLTEPRQW